MQLPTAIPILVFARAPTPGACKTRLIPGYGPLGAARLYRSLVHRSVSIARAADCGPVVLWATPTGSHPFFAGLSAEYGVKRMRQTRGDLGQRMAFALDQTLNAGAAAALLIGTDAANLSADDLRAAAQVLQTQADAVLQPSEDGGYVLIGARKPLGGTLRAVQWSSGRECQQSRARLEKRGFRVALLDARCDIDAPRDLRHARHQGWFDGVKWIGV
ncbi:MAG: TIGR04282 family arsenosugar biosynthesis glycosyltransferase [Panacagrimonas sp.]